MRLARSPQGFRLLDNQGDTLIEVTFALAILGFVILGATALAATGFRSGQTARERTQVADASQAQMEALRSFRDNHSWTEFRDGSPGLYKGVDSASTSPCKTDASKRCFHMELTPTTAGTIEWVPVPGPITAPVPGVDTLPVPGAVMEIWADDSATALASRQCNYNFTLYYSFDPVGSSVKAANHIATRLSNLRYDAAALGAGTCL